MDKYEQNRHALAALRVSREVRYNRKHPYYDPEIFRLVLAGFCVTAILLGALEISMDAIYDALDHAGVFAAIFKFMGW